MIVTCGYSAAFYIVMYLNNISRVSTTNGDISDSPETPNHDRKCRRTSDDSVMRLQGPTRAGSFVVNSVVGAMLLQRPVSALERRRVNDSRHGSTLCIVAAKPEVVTETTRFRILLAPLNLYRQQ